LSAFRPLFGRNFTSTCFESVFSAVDVPTFDFERVAIFLDLPKAFGLTAFLSGPFARLLVALLALADAVALETLRFRFEVASFALELAASARFRDLCALVSGLARTLRFLTLVEDVCPVARFRADLAAEDALFVFAGVDFLVLLDFLRVAIVELSTHNRF
jgi:hypothetical protein